jgi:hypothetical protein
MTERKGGCFTCGGEGHFARECPDSNRASTQRKKPNLATTHASIVPSPATSLESARSLRGKGLETWIGLIEDNAPRGDRGKTVASVEAFVNGATDMKMKRGDNTGLVVMRTAAKSDVRSETKKTYSVSTARSMGISLEIVRTVSSG